MRFLDRSATEGGVKTIRAGLLEVAYLKFGNQTAGQSSCRTASPSTCTPTTTLRRHWRSKGPA